MAKKKFKWSDLKKFVNTLPEKELRKEIIWWGEERGGLVNGAFQLTEDYVQTDYGCEPASVQEPEDLEGYDVSIKKGTPIINVD